MYCSIIIPTAGRAELLIDALNSLKAQSERDFETIVVCDGKDERTQAVSARYIANYPIRWVFNPVRLGLSLSRNTGAEEARGEILAFLDDDCLPVRNWLLHHLKHHQTSDSDQEKVVLGQRYDVYLHPSMSLSEQMLRQANEKALFDFDTRCKQMRCDFSWLPHCGMNSSIRRDTFWAAGGCDAAMEIVQDLELGTRLRTRGARMIYEPEALVWHRNSKNLIDHRAKNERRQGQLDVYRVRQKGQRTPQTQRLLHLHRTKPVRKLKERLAWQYPAAMQLFAELCRNVTDCTGSRLFFRLWGSFGVAAAYWEGVKSEGVSRNSLQELIGSPVPVLLFHSISVPIDRDERRHHLSPHRFRRFMKWLSDANYKTVSPSDLLISPSASRQVIITFDDAYDDFYSEAYPVLEQHGFSATLFVVVDRIGATNSWSAIRNNRPRKLLSLQQLRELHRRGMTLGSHSLTHAWLPGLTDPELRREVTDSKLRLEDLLGAEVTCFAYPSGGVDGRVLAAVAKAGYKIAMSVDQGLSFWDDPLAIRRIGVSERDVLADFMLKLIFGRSYRQDTVAKLQKALYTGAYELHPPTARMITKAVHWLRQ